MSLAVKYSPRETISSAEVSFESLRWKAASSAAISTGISSSSRMAVRRSSTVFRISSQETP